MTHKQIIEKPNVFTNRKRVCLKIRFTKSMAMVKIIRGDILKAFGNDSQETGSSVSNAVDSGASYLDTVTHVQAETFQIPKAVESASLYYGPTASDTNRHSHPSDVMCIPVNTQYGSTCASQRMVINS